MPAWDVKRDRHGVAWQQTDRLFRFEKDRDSGIELLDNGMAALRFGGGETKQAGALLHIKP